MLLGLPLKPHRLLQLDGRIVTFGIRPDRPETGYGWLELTSKPKKDFLPIAQPLLSFVEKPNAEFAKDLLDGGMHLWNAGIFLFSTSTILKAFEQYALRRLGYATPSITQRWT